MKFHVRLEETVRYSVYVDATDADEAEQLACGLWAASDDPTRDFAGEGYGVEVDYVEVVE